MTVYILLSSPATYCILTETSRKDLRRKCLNLRDGQNDGTFSAFVAALSCTKQ